MATNEELRAAAERCEGYYLARKTPPGAASLPGEMRELLGKVLAAYLAEHPADDDEPITEEWLRSVGWQGDRWRLGTATYKELESELVNAKSGDYSRTAICAHCHDSFGHPKTPELWLQTCGVNTIGDIGCLNFTMGSIKTRGAVRRLCAALGVPLK